MSIANSTGGATPRVPSQFSASPSKPSGDGVSVRSVPMANDDREWHVLRVSYHREQAAQKALIEEGIETFLPLRHTIKTMQGVRKKMQVPLLPNFLFARSTKETLDNVMSSAMGKMVSYYYDHFKTLSNGNNPPLTVPDKAMHNFIRLTSIANDHIMVVGDAQCHYKTGETVCVTDGAFKGVEGRVARIDRQQRVVVTLFAGCNVATAYIPSAFIKRK